MSTEDRPLRLPILTPMRLGVPAGAGVFSLFGAWAEGRSGDDLMVGLYMIGSIVMLTLAAFNWVPYRKAFIVLDESGFWLDHGSSRDGIQWENVQGYEKTTGRLTLYAKQGQPFVVRTIALPERLDAIYQVLDRRIGPDGERIGPARPVDPILAKVHDYYGNVPKVEMEPDVVYRHGNRDEMARLAKSSAAVASLLIPLGSIAFLYAYRLNFSESAFLILGMGSGLFVAGLFTLCAGLLCARRSRDRLVVRDGVLHLIRKGAAHPLPPAHPRPGSAFQGHPTTRYGKGPFAYEISMQFLEPDV